MSQIALKDVDIEFPMLHMEHRSLKKRILATATGGRIITSPGHVPMIRALTGVSMQLNAGDRVGLIGRNGAGKTTLLRTLAGVYEPIRGTIVSQGRIHSMLDAGLQLDMTGYENIRLRGQLLGLGREEMQEATAEIEAFTELGEFMRLPIRIYSTGMSMRLAFAMATIGKADILLIDEWVLAGDAAFMIKAKARMQRFADDARLMVLASHSDNVVRQNCSRVIWLEKGRIVADGATEVILQEYHNAR